MASSGPLASLRPQALLAFGLPAAPPRLTERGKLAGGGEILLVEGPAGPRLVLISGGAPMQLAFEAALYDLLAEHRFPAPRPKRSVAGSLIARLEGPAGPVAVACYAWPSGEVRTPAEVSTEQLLDLGRLLGRLHNLGETHPAAVADPSTGEVLRARLPSGAVADRLGSLLAAPSGLPIGATHGRACPDHVLFLGDRCGALVPSGAACSAPLVLDLAEALVGGAVPAPEPRLALRALVSGYQAQRRLAPEERDGLWHVLRHAAAREGARRALVGSPLPPLEPIDAVERLDPADVRAAAG